MMTHMGSPLSLFAPKLPLLSAEVSVRHLLLCKSSPRLFFYSLFLCGASSGFINLKSFIGEIFFPFLFLLSGKTKTACPGVNSHIHQDFPLCDGTADVIFPMVYPDSTTTLKVFGLPLLTFPLGAGCVYLLCFY